jgi:putative peptidoglycan lipid II flippase
MQMRSRRPLADSTPIVGTAAAAHPRPSEPSAQTTIEDRVPRPSSRRLATVLMSGAILSKVLGFAREVLMAQVIGASLVADSFRGAVTAVMLPLAFLQSEGVPAILIPMHREWQQKGLAPQRLAALTIAITLLALALMLTVQALGAWWVDAIVGGFSSEGQRLTLELVRIMALGMPASTLLNCLAAGEIALGRSRLTNARASLLNVAMLAGIVLLALTGRPSALAWAFAIAFNGLGVWAFWTLWRENNLSLTGLTPALVRSEGTEFLRRLFPLLALPTAEQGHIWIERALASRLATGAVASLDYARTLTETTLPLICQPVGLAVLASHPPQDARAQIEAIARPILAVALPASVFLFVFAPEVVRLVFYRGAFTETGVLLTSQALRGISAGLWAATLAWILLRVLNNSGRNVLAAIIVFAAYAVNIGLNLLTADMQATSGAGLLILGLGETARSCVLLAGIVLALECRGKLILLLLTAMVPASLMALLGWQIHQAVTGTIERLLAGGVACGLCTAIAVAMLMPASCRAGLAQVRNWFSTEGRA